MDAFRTVDGNGRSTDARILILAALAFAVLYLVFTTGGPGEDAETFCGYVRRMYCGELPYADYNEMYPPLAWLFILVPGLIGHTEQTFFLAFAGIQTLCMWLTLMVVLRTCRRHGIRTDISALVFMLMLGCYYSHAVFKFDAAAMLLLSVSLMLFLDGRRIAAYPVAMAGALIKVFPALAIPLFIVIGLRGRRMRETVHGILAAVIVASLVFVPLILVFGSDVLWFVEGNASSRGFHLESLVATVSEMACPILGMGSARVSSYNTEDVINPITEFLSPFWMAVVLGVMSVVLMLIASSLRFRDYSDEGRTRFVAASMVLLTTAFLLSNKVFSTSYVMWLLPVLPLFMGYREGRDLRIVSMVCVAVFLLSTIEVENGADPLILIVRDAMLVILLWWSVRYLDGGSWSVAEDASAKRPSGTDRREDAR